MEDVNPFETQEIPVVLPHDDLVGMSLMAANLYYSMIHNNFFATTNKFIILDATKGGGKTSFINLLISQIEQKNLYPSSFCNDFGKFILDSTDIIQLSVMPFLATYTQKPSSEEASNIVISLVKFISNNLDKGRSKYIRKLSKFVDSFEYQGLKLRPFEITKTFEESTQEIKRNLLFRESKTIIIIEDLDRLNDHQLKIIAKSLWFLQELPHTITILPVNENKLKHAINFNENLQQYEEKEEHKLLQASYPFQKNLYRLFANLIFDYYKYEKDKLVLNNANTRMYLKLLQLKDQFNYSEFYSELSNWEQQILNQANLQKSIQYDDLLNIAKKLSSADLSRQTLIESVINDIKYFFEKFDISFREFKYVMKNISYAGNSIFIVQVILYYMLEFRYKGIKKIDDYLRTYRCWPDSLEYPQLKYPYTKEDRIIDFPLHISEIVTALEGYPFSARNNEGLTAFINSLFCFIISGSNNPPPAIRVEDRESAHQVFMQQFLLEFIVDSNNQTLQSKYNSLSNNWYPETDQFLSLNLSSKFVILFNAKANDTINNSKPAIPYNLYLFQNMAIRLIFLIISDINFNNNEHNFFNYKKQSNPLKEWIIWNEFAAYEISIDMKIIREYFKRIFNISENLTYDETGSTLKENLTKIKDLLVQRKVDPVIIDQLFA